MRKNIEKIGCQVSCYEKKGGKMSSRYSHTLRFLSLTTLFFFMWSFGGLRDAALAAKDGFDTPAVKRERAREGFAKKGERPEEKLDKAVGEVEKIVKGFHGKKSKDERRAEKDRLNKHATEIETDTQELKKQFAETERMLIEKKLSPEKLKMHRDFVKEYDREYSELKKHLKNVQSAKTDVDEDTEIKNFETYIKKVKVERKRPKIDFDNLPHRNAEPTKLKPRLHKEEFETVQKAEVIPAADAYAMIYPNRDLAVDGYQPVVKGEPIRVAAVGPITGVLPEEPVIDFSLQSTREQFASPMLLAAASDLPKAEDLEATIDVQITNAVIAKAAELGNDPLKIYEWVRNNIEFAPTWGSIQGADYCLQTKLCNSFDTASLLIAMLRVSNVPARYVHGTIELPIEKAMNWAGDFTDPNAALQFMSAGGIPTGSVTEGGKITRAHFEHIWVEAWIDYIPSRGARHQNGKGDTWIPLDASYKQYNYTQGMDIAAGGAVDYQVVQDEVANKSISEILGTKQIVQESYSYLLGTLPYKKVVAGIKYSDLPDNLRHRWSMNIVGVAPISYTASLPELAGKKITLNYSPATSADEAVIESYLPAPHADGTPIDPSELPQTLPVYLIKLKPRLMVDGVAVVDGGPVMMGMAEDFNMAVYFPGKGTFPINNVIEAGEYVGIALDYGRISAAHVEGIRSRLAETSSILEVSDYSGLTKDRLIGDLLYLTALSYYVEYDVLDFLAAQSQGVNNMRLPSESIFFTDLKVNRSFFTGRPITAGTGGMVMDVDCNVVVARDRNGNHESEIEFMKASGVNSSSLENIVPSRIYSSSEYLVSAISSMKALKLASEQGIFVNFIDSNNLADKLARLSLDSDVVDDVIDAVNAGKVVIAPDANIDFDGWVGCGYIIFDPASGAGSYLISGGYNGSHMSVSPPWGLAILSPVLFIIIRCAFDGSCKNKYNEIIIMIKPTLDLAYNNIKKLSSDYATNIVNFLWLGEEYCGAGNFTWRIAVDSFVHFDFTEACHNHDICYGTSAPALTPYTWKAHCDEQLFSDMLDQCINHTLPSGAIRTICAYLSFTYYNTVTIFGDIPFWEAQVKSGNSQ